MVTAASNIASNTINLTKSHVLKIARACLRFCIYRSYCSFSPNSSRHKVTCDYLSLLTGRQWAYDWKLKSIMIKIEPLLSGYSH